MKNRLKNSKILNTLLIVVILCILFTVNSVLKKEKIVLHFNEQKIILSSYCDTVKDLLEENNINYDEDDIIYPSIDSKLKDNMEIKITYVQQMEISEHSRIAYETEVKKDSSLPKGTTKVTQQGKEGRKTIIYEEVYYDKKLVSRIMTKEIIRDQPTKEVIVKGTGTIQVASSLSTSKKLSSSKQNYNVSKNKMLVSATAYSSGNITATGTRPRWGTIAVDPRIIPYGTKVYIPKFNMTFVAEDCGGGIKGNKIDIFMNSSSQCYNWGVRKLEVYIVG